MLFCYRQSKHLQIFWVTTPGGPLGPTHCTYFGSSQLVALRESWYGSFFLPSFQPCFLPSSPFTFLLSLLLIELSLLQSALPNHGKPCLTTERNCLLLSSFRLRLNAVLALFSLYPKTPRYNFYNSVTFDIIIVST